MFLDNPSLLESVSVKFLSSFSDKFKEQSSLLMSWSFSASVQGAKSKVSVVCRRY